MLRLIGLAVLGLTPLSSSTVCAGEPEPEYGGKTLSAWSESLARKSATKEERRDAAWALYMIGPEAAPALVAALGSDDVTIRINASLVLELLGADGVPALAKALKSPNEALRTSAQIILMRLGPKAEAAVPILLELLREKDASALGVLIRLGPGAKEALPALAKLLESEDKTGWKAPSWHPDRPPGDWAGATLAALNATSVATLAEALKHPKEAVRRRAAYWLEVIVFVRGNESTAERARRLAVKDWLSGPGDAAKAARETLTKALSDEAEEVRWHAAHALATCGPAAKDAVPALLAALEDENRNAPGAKTAFVRVRDAAAEALGSIGPDAVTAVPALVKALKGPDSRLREAAAKALESLGPVAHEAAPALLEVLWDSKVPRWHVRGALRRMAPKVPALTKILNDPNETKERRLEVAHVLTGKDAAAIPVLVAALKEQSPEGRATAATSLAKYAHELEYPFLKSPNPEDWSVFPHADIARAKRTSEKLPPQIIPALIDALEDKSSTVRTAAADALAIVGHEAKAAIPRLLKIVEERADEERRAAIIALWAVGADTKTAGPALEDAIKGTARVAEAALFALTRMDPSPERAVAFLKHMSGQDWGAEYSARITSRELIALGDHAKAILPQLVGGINTQFLPNSLEWGAEGFSATVLIHLGDRAVPELVAALKDPQATTRCAAARLLGKIRPKAKDAAAALGAALQDEELVVRATATKALLLIDPQAARKLGLH